MTGDFDELHPRRGDGRFATKTVTEAPGGLDAFGAGGATSASTILPPSPHPVMVPPGTSAVALSQAGAWVHGRALDADLATGGPVRLVAGNGSTLEAQASDLLVDVDPSEYDGHDVDTVADVFGWSAKDWENYYDAREEREADQARSVEGVLEAVDQLTPVKRHELFERLALQPASAGPDGQIRAVVSTSGQDLTLPDDHHDPVPTWPEGLPAPSIELEYGDAGNLVTEVSAGPETFRAFYDADDGMCVVWWRGPGQLSVAQQRAVDEWVRAAHRRAAQAESSVRWAAFSSARDVLTQMTIRAMSTSQ